MPHLRECDTVGWRRRFLLLRDHASRLEEEEKDDIHMPQVEVMDGEFHVFLEHEMNKEHYISFFAYVTSNYAQFVKLYPEQNAECRFTRRGHGAVYAYCNRHGLYKVLV